MAINTTKSIAPSPAPDVGVSKAVDSKEDTSNLAPKTTSVASPAVQRADEENARRDENAALKSEAPKVVEKFPTHSPALQEAIAQQQPNDLPMVSTQRSAIFNGVTPNPNLQRPSLDSGHPEHPASVRAQQGPQSQSHEPRKNPLGVGGAP